MISPTEWTPEMLDALSPEERAEVEELLEDRYGAVGLDEFIRDSFRHEPPPDHIQPIIRLLERARHERIRVCISLPPRHAKTVTILRALVWWLINEPADTCAYYSYSDRQARSKSRIARNWARQCGLKIDPEAESTNEWRTMEGGGVLAGGLQSGLTGQGVSGVFIVDDPYKNRAEAESSTIRDKVWDNFNEVVYTRLEGASVIVVHTRWHEDDLIGRLSKDPTWEVVSIPAIAEDEDDPLGRLPGEPLWPERFDLAELETIRRQIGEWSFASLYQGRPQPKGANVFKGPTFYDPEDFDINGMRVVLGVDPAASESTAADYSVILVLACDGRGPSAVYYVLDVWRGQVQIPDLVARLYLKQKQYWGATAVVEAVSGFKGVGQSLRRIDRRLRVLELAPKLSKFLRAQPVAAAWNEGRVRIPTGDVEWIGDFFEEIDRFTGVNDSNDDQVDALAHAFNAFEEAQPVQRGARVSH